MKKAKRKKHIVTILLISGILVSILFGASSAGAEKTRVSIRQTDTSQYPSVSLMVSLAAEDQADLPVLTGKNFSLQENGKAVSAIEVEPILKEQEPMAVVLVLDTSASMKGKPLKDAKAAATTFIELMKPQDEVAIVAFGSRAETLSDLTTDKNVSLRAINRLNARGETALYDAIIASLDIASKNSHSNRNLIVISDGKDTRSANSLQHALDRAKQVSIPIFGIGLQSPEFDPASLQSICDSSGGEFLLTPDSSALNTLFSRLAKYLHNQYQVTFRSKRSTSKELALDLEVNVLGASASTEITIPNPKPLRKPSGGSGALKVTKSPKELPRSLGLPYILIGAALLSFLTVFLLALAVFSIGFPSGNILRDQLKFYDAARNRPDKQGTIDKEASLDKKIMGKALKIVHHLTVPTGFKDTIQLKLEQAGLPLRPLEFILFHFLFTLILGIIGNVFARNIGTIFMAGLGALSPILVLFVLIERRRARFHDQIADTLSLIAGSMQAGYGLLQGISVAVEETSPLMSIELRRVLAESRLGLPLEEALDKMAQRMQEQNFIWAVMAINIQREVGGNLVHIL